MNGLNYDRDQLDEGSETVVYHSSFYPFFYIRESLKSKWVIRLLSN